MSRRQSFYAKGRNAVAICQRSGQKMRYQDLVEDGHVPGLLVHPEWWEPRHPQELPVDASDAVALWRPSPETDPAEVDDCPASPFDLRYFESTTLAVDLVSGERRAVVEDAVTYDDHLCLYIELDGGGYIKSRTQGWYETQFVVYSKTDLIGSASAGNAVYIGPEGSNDPMLDGLIVIT